LSEPNDPSRRVMAKLFLSISSPKLSRIGNRAQAPHSSFSSLPIPRTERFLVALPFEPGLDVKQAIASRIPNAGKFLGPDHRDQGKLLTR
jgi:hypothetical protein